MLQNETVAVYIH